MKQRELLILSIVVFLTIISWLIIDIYNINKNKNANFKEEIKIPKVIKMDIDKSVIDSLRLKE